MSSSGERLTSSSSSSSLLMLISFCGRPLVHSNVTDDVSSESRPASSSATHNTAAFVLTLYTLLNAPSKKRSRLRINSRRTPIFPSMRESQVRTKDQHYSSRPKCEALQTLIYHRFT